jgi:predicted acyltransferase
MSKDTEIVKDRIVSVDVLRGFDMFWLIGGKGFVLAIAALFPTVIFEFFNTQLEHKHWEGFGFYDLIFPLFVFIMGMSIVFSFGRLIEKEGKNAVYKRLVRRLILLYLFGVIYYGGMRNLWPEIRLLGVLQRIALTYFIAGILYLNLDLKGLIITAAGILLGYWALLSFVPVPGLGHTSFSEAANWAAYIDEKFLPGRLYYGHYDPEGILSTIPAVVNALMGIFASKIILEKSLDEQKKVLYLIGGGVAAVIIGFLWGLQFPVIKKIWTSTYVLVSGGYSFILVGIFYQVFDIWKVRWGILPFIYIGANAITAYMGRNILSFGDLADRFVGGNFALWVGEDWGRFFHHFVAFLLLLALLRFLYKKKIFLKV